MKVAVASGKGGTGKTTVAASLVATWERPVIAVDLDVEEPNLHLFLRPTTLGRDTATLEVPVVDESRCTHCGACSTLCQFKAIGLLGKALLTFPEMCHGCGGCLEICPEGALTPGTRELGEIRWGRWREAGFLMGQLRIGEAMSPPLMRAVRAQLERMITAAPAAIPDVIIDAPPGVSCPAINAVTDSDLILLVTEPTPFGLYDLGLARQSFGALGIPLGVVINRAGLGDRGVHEYCQAHHLPVLAEIPFDRRVAQIYAEGQIVAEGSDAMRRLFRHLVAAIQRLDPRGAATHSTLPQAAATILEDVLHA